MDIATMTDEQILDAMTDQPVAVLELEDGDGIAVCVPGAVWADQYISITVHEDDCYVILGNDDDVPDTDRLTVEIPLDRLPEFRDALDRAEAIVRARAAV